MYYPSSHIGSAADTWNNDYFDDTYWHNGRREKFEGYTTDVFFREAMRWMGEQAAAGQPFFCYLATAAAHGPLFVPDKYREPYRPSGTWRAFRMIANIDENIAEWTRSAGTQPAQQHAGCV
jgi:arylsulfatase A-like enzyme